MLTFQLIGLAFAVMFFGSLITGNARTPPAAKRLSTLEITN